MNTSFNNVLIQKLDQFIRKYYVNQLIQGSLYTAGILVTSAFVLLLLEYIGHFNTAIRTALFFFFVATLIFTLVKWVVVPIIKIYRLGEVLSYEEAAMVIGNHFESVEDRLLNILQLNELSRESAGRGELLLASIDQKIEEIKPVPFDLAIDLRKNLKFAKFALIPVAVLLLMSLIVPDFLSEPGNRIINYNKEFIPVAPFAFKVQNRELTALRNDDFKLNVELSGKELPSQLYVVYEGKKDRAYKEDNTTFHHSFKNLQSNVTFRLFANGFYSESYELKVLPKALLLNFSILLDYPDYLKMANEKIENIGDLEVPEGTRVTWELHTENSDVVNFMFPDDSVLLKETVDNHFTHQITARNSLKYSIKTANHYYANRDEVSYDLGVIKDQFPEISLKATDDSLNAGRVNCSGEYQDDYGITALKFSYRVNTKGEKGEFKQTDMGFQKDLNYGSYFYVLDINRLELKPGDEIEYYFEVWDNDGVNGAKSARTSLNWYRLNDLEEMKAAADKSLAEIKDEFKSARKEAEELKKELDKMSRKLIDKKEKSWEDVEQFKSMLMKQDELRQKVEEMKNKYQKNNDLTKKYEAYSEELTEKQEELNKLMEEIMTDEMKETIAELQKLMDEMDKEKLNEEIDKMALTNEELSKELDRSLELMKQLEFEKSLEDNLEKLEELKKEQEKLAEKSENLNSKELKEQSKEQNALNDKFEQLKQDMDELREKNQEMEFPNQMESTEELEREIASDMEESKESMEKGDGKKAPQKQKDAAEGMDKMAQSMMQTQANMLEKQAEDIDAMRQLLDNIITASFDQENLMKQLKKLEDDDPKYVEAMVRQSEIRDNIKLIEDSLLALSKRVVQIQNIVNKEISQINNSINRVLKDLQERRTVEARGMQQYAMTSLNNLGLLLDEIIQQMQNEMAMKMPGSGSCNKPGKGKPKKSSLSDMQKKLNEQLKSMKEGKKNDGGKGEGGKSGENGNMPKELAKMAARQAAIRQELQKMGGKDGNQDLAREIEKIEELMEQTETDIVNKQITTETLTRQEEITTRLLESEKAEQERETDKERKSEEYLGDLFNNDSKLKGYHKKTENEVELLRTMIPSYNSFYKKKISEYFKSLSE